ncbi:hypothetical protein NW754_009618 [Fusarium falciforme]|nr:hypothetical protein NW754_009618 [Fusarium falciforme]
MATRQDLKRDRDIENIWQLSWRGGFYRGGPVFMSALSGIDIALWDMKGGKVRSKIRVYAWIGGDRPNEVEAQAALEPYEPLFIEEPLLSENVGGIKQLSELTTVPIALGERLYSRWDVRPFLENGAVDILQPDICHVGGISEMRRIAASCETYDIGVAPHCPLGPIALAANIQVDATLPNFAIQEMGIGMHYNNTGQDITSYITNPEIWTVRDGHIDILSGPGLGIEINEEEVRRLSKDSRSWPVPEFRGPCGELREW